MGGSRWGYLRESPFLVGFMGAWLRFEAAVTRGGAVRVQCAVDRNVGMLSRDVEEWTLVEMVS
jgi:hypothetical protein